MVGCKHKREAAAHAEPDRPLGHYVRGQRHFWSWRVYCFAK
jgi:hypothetical protein